VLCSNIPETNRQESPDFNLSTNYYLSKAWLDYENFEAGAVAQFENVSHPTDCLKTLFRSHLL
jgi:hypothetical protein